MDDIIGKILDLVILGVLAYFGQKIAKRLNSTEEKVDQQLKEAKEYADRQQLRQESLLDESKRLRQTQAEEDRRRAWKTIWEGFADLYTFAERARDAWNWETDHDEKHPDLPEFGEMKDTWIQKMSDFRSQTNRLSVYVENQELISEVIYQITRIEGQMLDAHHALLERGVGPAEELSACTRFFRDNLPNIRSRIASKFQVHLGVESATKSMTLVES